MTVVDASVWVSRLAPPDVNHAASREWLAARVAAGEQLLAPVTVLAEIAGAISRRTGEPQLGRQAVASLLRLRALRLVIIDRRLGEAAARLSADLALRGADAMYVAVARQLDVPLITWDKEQFDRAAKVIAVRPPIMP